MHPDIVTQRMRKGALASPYRWVNRLFVRVVIAIVLMVAAYFYFSAGRPGPSSVEVSASGTAWHRHCTYRFTAAPAVDLPDRASAAEAMRDPCPPAAPAP